MARWDIALTNPGAEAGNTSGWTVVSGTFISTTALIFPWNGPAYEGTHYFKLTGGGTTDFYQSFAVDAGLYTAVDAGVASIFASCERTAVNYNQWMYIEYYDVSSVLLRTDTTTSTENRNFWGFDFLNKTIPANTRTIRVGGRSTQQLGSSSSNWDIFQVYIDDAATAKNSQTGIYALANFESENIGTSQVGVLNLEASESSTGLFKLYSSQLGVYALCRGRLDPRKLRAWTFPQDDHIFYVLQLGDSTLVFDSWTGQWAQWKSPGFNFWRGADGLAWQGFNVCCDTESGIIWKIDDEGRKDEGDTPIESKVIGGLSERFRTFVPCYMAELAVSEGAPPSGIDASTVSITLRTSQDAGNTWTNHGSIPGEAIGDDITVRWYGLGLMKAPGHLFEIVDTGYARRIDGFDIKVSDDGSPQ